ncbi:hypothetical protein ACFFGH_10760 [Lysobacter korlensis]|uniref:Lipoprotein n=1 Tax=Lysobacter korlensis TaxID=553636 RepID=A0ABV6RMV7_9GAMM
MRLTAPAIALSLAAVALLAGCSSPSAAPVAQATPTQEAPAGPVEYGSVEELRDAYVDAGGSCDAWVQENRVTLAAESGDCNDSTVLMTFISESNRDELVATQKEMGFEVSLLVGPNWIVNADDIETVQETLGGTLVIQEAE